MARYIIFLTSHKVFFFLSKIINVTKIKDIESKIKKYIWFLRCTQLKTYCLIQTHINQT